jgi:hypothetical protein
MSTFIRRLLKGIALYRRYIVSRVVRLRLYALARQILIAGGELLLEGGRESALRRVAKCVPIFLLACFADAFLVWGEDLMCS